MRNKTVTSIDIVSDIRFRLPRILRQKHLRAFRFLLFMFVLFAIMTAIVYAVEVRFDPSRGLVEVEVLINGRAKGYFGIDTGADRFYLNSSFAERNNLNSLGGPPQRPVAGVHGSSKASSLDIRSLQIGDERLYNLNATIVDLDRLVSGDSGVPPDGLIGYDILRRFYVTVDYMSRRIWLRTGEPEDIVEAMPNAIPFLQKRHLIVVDVILDDEVEVPMILDYCASYTSITPELAARLGMDDEIGTRQRLRKVGLGDVMTAEDVACTVTDFDNLKKSARGIEFEGLLGGTFLANFKITVDYTRKRIYIHH